MKIGRLIEDDDGQYFVIPVDKVDEFWEDHAKAFLIYPIEQFRESGLHYQAYLDKWGDYMEPDYSDLDVLMESPDEILKLLNAASHALKSYQYGNQSLELAESVSKTIDDYIQAHKKSD